MTKAGFISIIGRPNAGKSSLMNWLLHEKIALISQKANATRKRLSAIVMHHDAQLIFVDTPGLHEQEKLLNQYMLDEALKALGDSDITLYLAPVTDSVEHYQTFLDKYANKKPHILLLSKIDQVKPERLLAQLSNYNKYSQHFHALIPISSKKDIGKIDLLNTLADILPASPFLYDPELLTTQSLREISKEFIREAIFDNISDEIPYESDVKIESFTEESSITHIQAQIIIEKESQKPIIIGKKGAALQRIGMQARKSIESLLQMKVNLQLFVSVKKGWSKSKESLKELGYECEL